MKLTYPVVASILTLLLGACSASSDEFAQERQSRANLGQNPTITQHDFALENFSLHYAEAGTPGKPIVVLIHGTPGSWYSLGRLMTDPEMVSSVHMIAIDRPGWGSSLLSDQRSEPDFAAQAKLIEPLLFELKEKYQQPMILAGHSYGGTITPYLAMRNPEMINGILMAASAIDPELGKPRWYNWAASVWPISWAIGDDLRIANDEIWGVKDALKELENWWADTNLPMIYVQGEEDELVNPGNLDFASSQFPQDTSLVVRLADQGHLLHVQRSDLLCQLTLTLVNAIETNTSVRSFSL